MDSDDLLPKVDPDCRAANEIGHAADARHLPRIQFQAVLSDSRPSGVQPGERFFSFGLGAKEKSRIVPGVAIGQCVWVRIKTRQIPQGKNGTV